MNTFTYHDFDTAYDVHGSGPDVVLVHGWCSSRHMWDDILGTLSAHFRCWIVDLPGFGDSAKPPEAWYTIPNYAEWLLAFLRAHQLTQVNLVGHSMGGMVALEVALREASRLTRLALINPLVTGRANLRLMSDIPNRTEFLHRALRLARWVHPSVQRLPDSLHHKLASLKRRQTEWIMAETHSIMGSGLAAAEYSLLPRLDDIHLPTLVMLGTRDVILPNSEGLLVVAHVPHCRLATFRAGHMLIDDYPHQSAACLRDFLTPSQP